MPVTSWSTTAATNATADSGSGIVWSEGMAPAQVNDSARAMMAVIKGDFANSIGTTGYQKLPNGLILQWSVQTAPASGNITWTLPIVFPSAIISAYGSPASNSTTTHCVNITSGSASTVTANINVAGVGVAQSVYLLALGA